MYGGGGVGKGREGEGGGEKTTYICGYEDKWINGQDNQGYLGDLRDLGYFLYISLLIIKDFQDICSGYLRNVYGF